MTCGSPHYLPLPQGSEDISQTAKLANELAMAIHLGDLKSGAPLREVEIADGHGVSRTIVRAALQRLEAQGLADIVLNKGARVRMVAADAVDDLIRLHASLFAMAARRAAERANDGEISLMRRYVDMMEHAAGEGAASKEVQHLRVGFARALFDGAGATLAERLNVAAPAVPHHERATADIATAHGQKEVARLSRDVLAAIARHDAEAAAMAAETLLHRHGERVRPPTEAPEPQRKRNSRAA